MSRPLRKEFVKDINVHYYVGGTDNTTKLSKQIGSHRYLTSNGKELILSTPSKAQNDSNYGYVELTTKTNGTKYLSKLTKNIITTTDSNVYKFEYTPIIENGVVVGIKQDDSADIIIDGLVNKKLDFTNFTYQIINGEAVISGYTGSSADAVIPKPY